MKNKNKEILSVNTTLKITIAIAVIILPFNFLTLLMNRIAIQDVIQQAQYSAEASMRTALLSMEAEMTQLQNYLYSYYKTSPNWQKIVNSKEENDSYEQARIQTFWQLENYTNDNEKSDNIFIYNENFDDLIAISRNNYNIMQDKDNLVQNIVEKCGKGWSVITVNGNNALFLSLKLDGVYLGCWIETDDYIKMLEEGIGYNSAKLSLGTRANINSHNKVIHLMVSGEKYPISLYGSIDRAEVVGGMSNIYRILQIGAILSLLLIPAVYYMISRMLLSPLSILSKAYREIGNGNLTYRINANATLVEYRHSFDGFNEMAEKIRLLKIENYEKQLSQKQLALTNLQLQIRPHFLLNCFNQIYTLAQSEKTDAIQEIILYLSDYFRYLFRNDEKLQLFPKEQKLMEGYIRMAKIRYPGCIEATFEYDPEISMVRLPPLLLHNFLENVVTHSVRIGSVTHISVVGQYSDRMVTFMITDDGEGMDQCEVDSITEEMKKDKISGRHVGFCNSYQRIKYAYGEKGDVSIISEKGIGTCITITIPYDLEEEDESPDCK